MHTEVPGPVSTESLRGDLRQALRRICRAPAFAATVVLLLACGLWRQRRRLAPIGAAVGLLASALAGRLLSGLLYGVRAIDVETLLLTLAILAAVATVATLIPAWRSSRVEPIDALRTE